MLSGVLFQSFSNVTYKSSLPGLKRPYVDDVGVHQQAKATRIGDEIMEYQLAKIKAPRIYCYSKLTQRVLKIACILPCIFS